MGVLRASKDTLSCWSRLHLESVAPTPVSRMVDVRQAAGRKIIADSLSQHNEKHVVPTPFSGIREGKRIDIRDNVGEYIRQCNVAVLSIQNLLHSNEINYK
jgi:hypothetical protein